MADKQLGHRWDPEKKSCMDHFKDKLFPPAFTFSPILCQVLRIMAKRTLPSGITRWEFQLCPLQKVRPGTKTCASMGFLICRNADNERLLT